MKDGFIKVAAITPNVKVADVDYNCQEIVKRIQEAAEKDAKVMVFPELSITGYTCQDLFLQDALLEAAKCGLKTIKNYSRNIDGIIFVGLPLDFNGKLYNVAAAISRGKIQGIVPKIYLPNYSEFYEARHFMSGKDIQTTIVIDGEEIPFGTNQIFTCEDMPSLRIAVELCEDLWVPNPPSVNHCLEGANVIVNLSASDQIIGKARYRRNLVNSQSARLVCGYIYTSAGPSESTQDVVYSGHNIISENGKILSESKLLGEEMTVSEIDTKYLEAERRKMTTYQTSQNNENRYVYTNFTLEIIETNLTRIIEPKPFVPSMIAERELRSNEILTIQAMGLKKRLEHIGCKTAVIGISGGLDSTLALLVTAKAFDYLGLDRKGIVAVTMPGFGTTDRTYDNAVRLIKEIGATFKEVSIVNAVEQHFNDIEQDPNNHDVTYENSQARERTQILMDIANKENGIVIGTGDLSELALGWATYNGDHMSMYAVNVSIPKTLVRYLVQYYADTCEKDVLSKTLYDVLDTPVSPELLPPTKGEISQKTEDLVGPYELHDFFIYHMLRLQQSPAKIYRLAKIAFTNQYSDEEILKWEKIFCKRFFAQHFKRSCLPDGPKVGSVAVSPRGDLRMPSDASAAMWLKELECL
ncbi:NAD+ synthase (glutamine-hydrolysing) [Pseudobutyrivibrio sp. NOR37]|uniref:Glutamine-dependent NAD(+) synthetase n=1 Tax=Pseudobutyrivibrio xylanivorans TaxID=185007 RepID=A0A6M0LL07_PSEXY|nr:MULTISPECIES: NAD(+) synthase [Pseudobutyrivibrio]NEX02663.1 NAD(+) synthase [Pseudobutyrivibrio xylanivorans]SFR80177.1 NAD+ synthase (glutamine-hydrolysing) [Pseudobutyrivibrio sp. NOR37]